RAAPRPASLEQRGAEAVGLRAVRHVPLERIGGATGGPDALDGSFGAGAGPVVVDGDGRALGPGLDRDLGADAPAAAGDEDDAVRQAAPGHATLTAGRSRPGAETGSIPAAASA